MFARYAKAIIAALSGGVATAVIAALADGSISGGEWVGIIVTLLGAGGITAAVPNRTAVRIKPTTHDNPLG